MLSTKQIHMSDEDLGKLRIKLEKTITNPLASQSMIEMASDEFDKNVRQPIKEIIQKSASSHSSDMQYFVTNEVVNLLIKAKSLQEWSQICVDFYNSDGKKALDDSGRVACLIYPGNYMNGSYAYWSINGNLWTTAIYETVRHGGHRWGNLVEQAVIQSCGSYPYPQQFKLLSTIHVAAMIGDKKLMQFLQKCGKKMDDNFNFWSITPFEIAVSCANTDSIVYLLELGAAKDVVNKGLKLAVEKGSFNVIECLLKHNTPVTDEVLKIAKTRDKDLGDYLEGWQRLRLDEIANKNNPVKALQSIFDYSGCCIQLMLDFIITHPAVVSDLVDETKGHTLLHLAVTQKNTEKFKSLMSAIFEAGYFITDGYTFDMEKKDKANKTVLDLAFEAGDNEIISAIFLYGDPKFSVAQQDLIRAAKLDIPAIEQDRKKIISETTRKICHMQIKDKQELKQEHICTVQIMMAVAEQQEMMKNRIEQLEDEVSYYKQEVSQYKSLIENYASALMAVCQHVGMNLPHEMVVPLQQQKIANHTPRFFILPTPVQELDGALQNKEDPVIKKSALLHNGPV